MQGGFLTYNGITLGLVKTNSVDTESIYTPDGVDYLYSKVTININAIFNAEQTAYTDGVPPVLTPGTLPPVTYAAIRHVLMQPRQPLLFQSLSYPIIAVLQEGEPCDANNGPFPRHCIINRIDGCQLYHVNFVVETYIIECPNNSEFPILSNRYSQSHTINSDFYTIVTTRGAAYFRTDILQDAGNVADQFRTNLLPLVPQGYKRTNIDFRINTAANIIEYDVRDEQIPYELGDTSDTGSGTFVTRADGFYTLQSISAGPEGMPGGNTLATMNVKLWGARQANNWVLTQLAFSVLSNKLPLGVPPNFIVAFSISQSIVERFIDVTVSMRLPPQEGNGIPFVGGIQGAGLKTNDAKIFGSYGGVNPSPSYDNGTRGDSNILLLSSQLKDACIPPIGLTTESWGGNSSSRYSGPSPQVTTTPTNILPSKSSNYSQDTEQSPITSAEINSYYNTNEGVYQAPVAAPQQSPSNPGNPVSGSGNTPTTSVLSLHLPLTQRRVVWTVERVGDFPKIPAWNSSNTNEVLMNKTINPMDVQLTLDGSTPVFRISGEYVYALKSDFNTLTQLNFDIPQWVSLPYGNIALPLPGTDSNNNQYVVGNIIDPA